MSKSKRDKGGYEKFETQQVQEEDTTTTTPGVEEEGSEVVPEAPKEETPPLDTRSPSHQAATAFVTGRPLTPLKIRPDAHPLLVGCYEMLQKFLAAHIIAPFAYLAHVEAEDMVDKLKKEIELVE